MASMSQIASELGMTKSNLYYYFRSKEEILFAAHQHLMAELLDLLRTVKLRGGNPEEQLRALTEGFVHIVVDEFHASALTQNIRGMTLEHQREIIRLRDRFERYYRKQIHSGIDAGTFRPVNVSLAGFAIFGAVNWIHRWHDQNGACVSSQIATEFGDFVLGGLRKINAVTGDAAILTHQARHAGEHTGTECVSCGRSRDLWISEALPPSSYLASSRCACRTLTFNTAAADSVVRRPCST